jgi:uncharacterized protein (TIGR00725 family)
VIAVVGPGDDVSADAGAEVDAEVLAMAEQVGRLLAEAGHDIVTGGLGGVMAAAARGARAAGGRVVALLPGDDPSAANPDSDVVIATGLGQARNVLVVRSAAAVIAVGGSWGTLSEVAIAMRLGRPVVWLMGWDVSGPAGAIPTARSAEEAVAAVVTRLSAAPDPPGS